MSINYTPIGILRTPHKTVDNMPIQPVGAKEVEGVAEIIPNLSKGLDDLEEFSHMILIYHLHKIKGFSLHVKPFMDTVEHGIFATRSPKRPNPIGISIVKIIKIEENKVIFSGADMLDETPILDIKPFFRHSDNQPEAFSGWLENKTEHTVETTKSDNRFN